ncbi:transcription factor TFIIIB component B'' homolog [Dendrobium catenatum]|uniref:SANT domain-containing protein n=1 Tax=Dendrobium catenatum TaxID=906689 RepID=A0A2I0VY76_9ASPA|nr:transcription factor TFIIIB component B'' homolog [Dendrobium catenatum]PKU68367.1 hypothetical protein MA16_Dca017719 [Dendrobium catenatum]
MFPILDLGDDLLQLPKTTADPETLHSNFNVRDDLFTHGTTVGRNIKFNPKSHISNNRNPRKPSTYRASEGPSSTSKFHNAVDDEHVKKFQSELQDIKKNASASYEYSQLDSLPSHNESLDAHGSNFYSNDPIESLEIKAPSCFPAHLSEERSCCLNFNDLEVQSLTANEDIHTVEAEHTIDHIGESNLEECVLHIVQNGEARKSSMKVRSGNEHVKKLESELQDATKSASANHEYSQMDSLPSHNELLDAHDSSFSASDLIESLKIKAPSCFPTHSSEERACCLNINDLEAQPLTENEDLHTMEAEHTIDHIEESNLEDCTPSIVQNGAGKSSMKLRPRNKKLKTNEENFASTDQIAKKIIPEMDDDYDGDSYNDDDMPKQKKRKLPRKSSSRSKHSEVPDSTANDTPKKRLQHGSSRCKSARRQVNEGLLEIPEDEVDRKKLVITDLIRRASFKERISSKEAAASKNSFVDKCVENEQDSNDNDRNIDIQQEGRRINYHSYMKRTLQTRWSKTDTELFYQAIRQYGTDFAMIQVLFPNRSRQQVKAKFKNEQRKHPLQIADALVHRSKDHSHFEKFIQHLQTVAEQKTKNTASDPTAQSEDEGDQNEEEMQHVL